MQLVHLLALELPRFSDLCAYVSGLNDGTEFIIHHVFPAYAAGHGVFAVAKRIRRHH